MPFGLENQLGILAKKDARKTQYALISDQGPGPWKIKFSTIGQKIHHKVLCYLNLAKFTKHNPSLFSDRFW